MTTPVLQIDSNPAGAPLLTATKGQTVSVQDVTPGPAPHARNWSFIALPGPLASPPTITLSNGGQTATFTTNGSTDGSYSLQCTRTEITLDQFSDSIIIGVPDDDGHVLPPAGGIGDQYGTGGSPTVSKRYGWMGGAESGTNFMLDAYLRFTKSTAKTALTTAQNPVGIHPAVQYATTTSLPTNTYDNTAGTLTAAGFGALVVDGATLSVTSPLTRVLVKDEALGGHNGSYVVTQAGDGSHPFILTRAADANANGLISSGMVVKVQSGTANHGASFGLTTPAPITLGTTALIFARLDGQVILTLFGAIGDNSTDCTAAINAADAAAVATSYPVFAPPGTYLHTGYTPSAAGIQWQGAGRLVSSLKLSASATQAVNIAHDDVTFEDIGIDGGGHATGQVVATSGKRTTFERCAIVSSGSTSPILLAVAAGAGFRIDDIDLENVSAGAIQITDYADLSWVKGAFNKSACAAPLLKFVSPSTTAHDFVLVEDSKWTVSSGDAATLTARQPVRITTTTLNAYISVDGTGTERAIAYECSFTQSGVLANGPFYDSGSSPGTLTYSGATETNNYKEP